MLAVVIFLAAAFFMPFLQNTPDSAAPMHPLVGKPPPSRCTSSPSPIRPACHSRHKAEYRAEIHNIPPVLMPPASCAVLHAVHFHTRKLPAPTAPFRKNIPRFRSNAPLSAARISSLLKVPKSLLPPSPLPVKNVPASALPLIYFPATPLGFPETHEIPPPPVRISHVQIIPVRNKTIPSR